MERLTEKGVAYITSGANVLEIPDIVEGHKYTGQAIIKLGQLEDIEEKYCIRSNEDLCRRLDLSDKYGELTEQLGIDLVTFFKYLSAKEVFFINDFNEIKRAVVRSIDKKGLIVFEEAFSWGECDFTLYFKDYGKTWALTKEELEGE